ncbi:hypothetical protein SBA3_2170020 [Candidatus Sulfopaludibacter sp. SbA3]|nr:hypothetical protein SBA3_2170020 [Candidatus Sulfopaludibacter sp. SbA3]
MVRSAPTELFPITSRRHPKGLQGGDDRVTSHAFVPGNRTEDLTQVWELRFVGDSVLKSPE